MENVKYFLEETDKDTETADQEETTDGEGSTDEVPSEKPEEGSDM